MQQSRQTADLRGYGIQRMQCSGPPEDLNVTGWRDPSVFSWESYDIAQGRHPGSGLYGIVAGGIKDRTPTVFLYSIDRSNIMKWTFSHNVARPGSQLLCQCCIN